MTDYLQVVDRRDFSTDWRRYVWPVGMALALLVGVAAFDLAMGLYRWWGTRSATVTAAPFAFSIVIATVFWRCTYRDFVVPLRLATRCCAAGLIFYLVVEPPDFTLANASARGLATYVEVGYWVALATSILGLLRPSFIVPTALYIFSTRYVVEHISGFPLSTLDIKFMVDMSVLLAVGGIVAARFGPRAGIFFGSPDRQYEVLAVGLALHLANYFWSGYAKLVLGPRPWSWIVENHTFNSILFSFDNRTLPLALQLDLVNWTFKIASTVAVPLNLAIVAFQLFALVCIWRRRWLRSASIAYDFLHVGIYLLGGLFFWTWIWNNLTVLVATSRSRGSEVFPLSAKLACIAAILLAGPMVKAAKLAWWDVIDVRENYLVAVTDTGAEARIPTAFFLSHSYAVSHGYLDRAPRAGQYPFTIWASAPDYDRNVASGSCSPPGEIAGETDTAKLDRMAKVGQFLKAHHAKMLERPWALGYYFRSHHHPSNPFLYSEFNGLDLRNVVGYKLITESICLGFGPDGPTKRVLARQEEYYDVK